MKYENASDIFPEELLNQIQKYVQGKIIYVPIRNEKRGWGSVSGYKDYLRERNLLIKEKFATGIEITLLSEEFFLSEEAIKKIVYSRKEEFVLEYECTLSSALKYASINQTENWIHEYLLSDGHNKAFSDGLKLFDRYFIGPIEMPFSLFERCCGPEETMKYQTQKDSFEKHVTNLMEVIKVEKDMPPLIANFVDGHFELNDGNHRFEAYARLGIKDYYFIIWITEKTDYDLFTKEYSNYLSK